MRKNFFQRIQQVKILDILHIFLFVVALIPSIIYKYTHKPFWLICDYKDEARDNGYYFYKYMTEKHKSKNVIYAINKKSKDYQKVKTLGKTVQYGSLLHWIYYLSAEINISSQKGGKPNAAVCYLLEIYNIWRNKRVFLQHGIIKDDLPYIHYDKAKFSMFTVSTKQEYDYVTDIFEYPEGIIKQVGLCRFDDLIDTSNNEIILIMPTWRQWISNGDSQTKDVEDISDFTHTEYFQKWNSLINSKQLENILNKYNKKIIFYIHRNMQQYIDNFKTTNKNITIAKFPEYDVHDLLKSSSLILTDYSSVAMDFAYMNKPVLYYQFDYKKFRENHMEEGYFSYQNDGFGEIEEEETKIIQMLEKYIQNDFVLSEKYQERINKFFDIRDKHNCDRTYWEILKLTKNNKKK